MSAAPLVVILAAGSGTRMRSALPKVLHPLAGRPMVDHVLDAAGAVTGQPPVVVVSPGQEQVREALGARARCIEQPQPLGSGDALRAVPSEARSDGPVLVLYGDVPLLRAETLQALVAEQERLDSNCVLLAATPSNPGALGRLLRGDDGRVEKILEASEFTPGVTPPSEINVGAYLFKGSALWPALDQLTANNAKGEVFLTDTIAAVGGADSVALADVDEAIGVNDRAELARAEGVLRQRLLRELMLGGVTIIDPATTYVDAGARIGQDSVIHPMTTISGNTQLGSGCEIGPMARLDTVTGGDRVRIEASILEHCRLGNDVTIGNYNRVRPDSILHDGVWLGTHAEVKNSTIGSRSRISHFSCVLDSEVGEDVNIGAGAVTCNFDGVEKMRTRIGDRVFVGTNATLVAPLTLADDSYVAAGSFINDDVPAGALGVGRASQRNIEGWSKRRSGKASS